MNAPRDPEAANNGMVFVDPSAHLEVRMLAASAHDAAARLLANHPGIADADAGRTFLETIADRPKAVIFGAYRGSDLIGIYALTKDGMANDLASIVVDLAHRRLGIGRMLLQDALRCSGKRSLVA